MTDIVEESPIDGVTAGSTQDPAVMEAVAQNILAEKQAEIDQLKEELSAEKDVVLALRKDAEDIKAAAESERDFVLQQQADLAIRIKELDDEKKRIREAALNLFNSI